MNIRLTDELVQAVRDTVDVVEIAGEMTRLKRAGKRFQGLCPFHKEKTPSFSVDPAQGLYYCFGCGAGGDAIKLYQEQTGDDFPAAIEALARRYGIPLPAPRAGPGAGEKKRDLRAVLEAAAEHFVRQLEKSDFARGYLDRRRIPTELRKSYGLGYAPDGWRHLLEALGGRFPLQDLIASGLVAESERTGEPYDRFRQRLIFPIYNPSGRLVGFGGRTLGDDRAKYVNTSETEHFHKANLLYGFHLAKRQLRDGGKALLVEGYFDVIGAAACGLGWAVAGMGTALSGEQARLLSRYVDEVVVGYDGDEAGEKAHRRALPILLAAGLTVRRARFPAGHDPDSLRLEAGPEAVRDLVDEAADAVTLEIDRLAPGTGELDPRGRTEAASAVGELLRPIRDNIVRYAYGQRAAERLGIPLEMLWRRSSRQPGRPRPGDAGGASDGSGEPSIERGQRGREMRTEEEKALALILQPEAEIPALAELPPAEVFFDRDCRSIYAAFYALYRERESAPTASDVVASLNQRAGRPDPGRPDPGRPDPGRPDPGRPDPGAVDRVARLLLQESEAPGEGPGHRSLQQTLDRLLYRWRRKQREPALLREIAQAQERNDHARLAQLLEEKKDLSRSVHPEMTGKLW